MYDDIVGRCYYGAYGAIKAPSALARCFLVKCHINENVLRLQKIVFVKSGVLH